MTTMNHTNIITNRDIPEDRDAGSLPHVSGQDVNALAQDLADRWRPSGRQIELANQLLAGSSREAVYTAHLLKNKVCGMWAEDVEVFALAHAVFTEREACRSYADSHAQEFAKRSDVPWVSAYAVHAGQDAWAVFESRDFWPGVAR